MPDHDWNDHYLQGCTPWDTEVPDPLLVEYLAQVSTLPRRALDVGCGTGTHALWLAAQGIDVLGVDVAAPAIERARAKAATSSAATVRFVVLDFLATLPKADAFDLVFDRGVFHVFDESDDRTRFASQVARCLAPSGRWLSVIGSTEGPPRDEGPPRRSARDIAEAIEPALEILELRTTVFDADRDAHRARGDVSRGGVTSPHSRRPDAPAARNGRTPRRSGAIAVRQWP